MHRKLKSTKGFKLTVVLLQFLLMCSLGKISSQVSNVIPDNATLSDPISVDSLSIIPEIPYSGDEIILLAATTHSSSPCGLLDYEIIHSSTNMIYVKARYWQGPLNAICHSLDKFKIGPLRAGNYIINFMNMKRLAFTVYSHVDCKADFEYRYAPEVNTVNCVNGIQFIDKSIGNIDSWKWDFGDGTISTLQNPVHCYSAEGVYEVCLEVKGSLTNDCYSRICKKVVVPPEKCKAKFSYEIIPNTYEDSVNADIAISPLPSFIVKFRDESIGNVIKWYWDFGDGTSSNIQNPVHRYREGKYIVTLKIATKEGCESKYQDTLVLEYPHPYCQYRGTVKDYSGLDGCKYIIELDNGTKLEPVVVNQLFEFYDGQRVIVDYDTLNVGSICMVGIPAEITCIREIITPACKARFVYERDTLVDCLCYNFYDRSRGDIVRWYWDFGDGTTSTEQNPRHVFEPTGSNLPYYLVCLTVASTNGCTDTYCDSIIIGQPYPRVPWKPVIGGDENHTIVVSEELRTNFNLEYGDYIGLFFRDYDGSLVCGGMLKWKGENTILTAWGNTSYYNYPPIDCIQNDCMPFRKNGFNNGEKFEYKIWKWRTNKEHYFQNAKYLVNEFFPDSGNYVNDGFSLLKALINFRPHIIPLHKGWNIISSFRKPVHPEMKAIFGDRNVIVKNYSGKIIYCPQIGITDGIWNISEGYKVKAFENTRIKIFGRKIPPQTIIQLSGNQHPYILPYYYPRPYPIKMMMREINDDIRYVQTYKYINGQVKALNYIPKYGIDQIKYMEPGYGYKLSLYHALRSFTYPPVLSDTILIDCCLDTITHLNPSISAASEGGNRILIIPKDILSIKSGSKVTAYINEGELVGHETADGANFSITLWDNPLKSSYNIIKLKIEQADSISEYSINLDEQTTKDGDLYLLKGTISNITSTNNAFELVHKVYPTLVKQDFYVDVYLDKTTDIHFTMTDLSGRIVKKIDYSSTSKGFNQFKIEVGNLHNGQYIYMINSGEQFGMGKLHLDR